MKRSNSKYRRRKRERDGKSCVRFSESRKPKHELARPPRAAACVTPENHRHSSLANSLFPSSVLSFLRGWFVPLVRYIRSIFRLVVWYTIQLMMRHRLNGHRGPFFAPLSSFSRAGNVLIGVLLDTLQPGERCREILISPIYAPSLSTYRPYRVLKSKRSSMHELRTESDIVYEHFFSLFSTKFFDFLNGCP